MHRIRKNHRYGTKGICLLLAAMLAVSAVGCRKEEAVSLEEADFSLEEEGQETGSEEVAGSDASDGAEEGQPEQIYVYVCGQVANPGVYELPPGSRVFEAINAAGGLLDAAAGYMLNQAEKMEDGQKIYVPSEEEAQAGEAVPGQADGMPAGSAGPESGEDSDGKININSATKDELRTLSGIGEKKAQAIISYRESHGGFQSAEELMEVEGIKTGTYEKIKDRIKI